VISGATAHRLLVSTPSPTRRVAAFAATLAYDDLPADVVRVVKALTLDTLGTALAGATLGEGCREMADVVRELGGPPQSTLLGTTTKVSVAGAALANGALTNALNYSAAGADVGHTGAVCLVAQLALAEARAPVSGRRFLTAAAIAAEVLTRMSLASSAVQHLGSERLLLSGQYFGYLSTAAGAGAIVGLDTDAMHSALGLALMQTSGTRQVIVQGDPPAKAVFGAFPNHGAVVSVLLAERGLGAQIDALDGRAGFYALAGGRFDESLLLDELGTRFRLVETTFKPWPVSGVVTPFIEAALELAVAHDLRPAEIERVEVVGSPHIRQWCEPAAERRRPSNGASAANSTLFATAKALAHRRVVLADFAGNGLRDPVALAIADRTAYRPDERPDRGSVVVHTTGGGVLEAAVDTALGHPARPLSGEQLRAKFRDCCAAVPLLTAADVEALIELVAGLDRVDDVRALADVAALRGRQVR
jgi:2-methylcitrate dehydratase PrpD